jgi:putative spermidine/putrescine transport system ATP-binding protein
VLTTSFLGAVRRTRIRLADGTELAVQHGTREHPAPGEHVRVTLAPTPVTVAPAA